MVRLRLRRKGRKDYPVYDIVAVDARKPRDGAYLEKLGWYDPNTNPNTVKMDPERALYWLGVGAQPSDTVREMFSYEGVLLTKHLRLKGKSEDEIVEAVKAHKEITLARFNRRKDLRKKRIDAKKKAAAAAEEAAKTEGAE